MKKTLYLVMDHIEAFQPGTPLSRGAKAVNWTVFAFIILSTVAFTLER